MCSNAQARWSRRGPRIAGGTIACALVILAGLGAIRLWLRATGEWHAYVSRVARHVGIQLCLAAKDGALDVADLRNMDNRRLVLLLAGREGFQERLPEMRSAVSRGELVDPWSRPYRVRVFMLEEGRARRAVLRVASCGANGLWEDGFGDDLTAEFPLD